jgi:tRNA-binding protein
METIGWDEFSRVEIRVGTIVEVKDFPKARKPLYRIHIDFGPEIGILHSAAGLTRRYQPHELQGRQILAAVNLGTRNIAGFESQCLTLGVPDSEGEAILLVPTDQVPDGGKLF